MEARAAGTFLDIPLCDCPQLKQWFSSVAHAQPHFKKDHAVGLKVCIPEP